MHSLLVTFDHAQPRRPSICGPALIERAVFWGGWGETEVDWTSRVMVAGDRLVRKFTRRWGQEGLLEVV